MAKLRLELYVVGQSLKSLSAVENVRRICAARAVGGYDLRVIDVVEQPGLAEAANIVATPTLVKLAPPPTRRIIGDLSATDAVMQALGIEPHDSERESK